MIRHKLITQHYKIAKGFEKQHANIVRKTAITLWQKNHNQTVPIGLEIASLYHDIDRSYPNPIETMKTTGKEYDQQKKQHEKNCSKIFKKIADKKIPQTLINDICYLIEHHEQGGDHKHQKKGEYYLTLDLNDMSDTLYQADKIAFFEQSQEYYETRGEQKLKDKIRFSTQNLPKEIRKTIIKEFQKKPKNKYTEIVLKELMRK